MSLLKTVAILAVIGVILFDIGAVVVNHVQADELAQRVLRSAVERAQTPQGRQPAALTEAAQAELAGSARAELEAATLDERGLTITVTKDAPVLLLDRLGPLSDLATARVTKTAELLR